ncbi:MAG: hypothetical protein AB4050_10945 [Synechococcus sp.]
MNLQKLKSRYLRTKWVLQSPMWIAIWSEHVNFLWYGTKNWWDALNPVLIKLLSGRKASPKPLERCAVPLLLLACVPWGGIVPTLMASCPATAAFLSSSCSEARSLGDRASLSRSQRSSVVGNFAANSEDWKLAYFPKPTDRHPSRRPAFISSPAHLLCT